MVLVLPAPAPRPDNSSASSSSSCGCIGRTAINRPSRQQGCRPAPFPHHGRRSRHRTAHLLDTSAENRRLRPHARQRLRGRDAASCRSPPAATSPQRERTVPKAHRAHRCPLRVRDVDQRQRLPGASHRSTTRAAAVVVNPFTTRRVCVYGTCHSRPPTRGCRAVTAASALTPSPRAHRRRARPPQRAAACPASRARAARSAHRRAAARR